MATTNERGFHGYAEFTDSYGGTVRVQESSAAMGPHCWVWSEGGGIPASGGTNDGSAHLNVEQAIQLRDALDEFIREAATRWANSGEHMPESERKRLGIQWLRVAVDKDLPEEAQKIAAKQIFVEKFGPGDVDLHSREEYDGEHAAGVWDVQRILDRETQLLEELRAQKATRRI
jgi:hypothetical protein